MTKTSRAAWTLMWMAGGVFAAALTTAVVGAQATRSVNEGVFTAAQAARGSTVYTEQCAACHGDNLEGSGPMPALAGTDFLANWQGKTLGDLYEKTQTSMPATAPGTLTPEQTADTVAYLLSVGKFPAGMAMLEGKMDVLLKIGIEAPMAAGAAAPVVAAGAHSVNDGVYTAEQATLGDTVYKEQCAACHGDNLEGSGPMPALAGPDFLANWQGKTLGDLYEKTQTSMPATAPGTLTPEQTAETVAYLLKVGKFPAGMVPLEGKMDSLLKITIEAPK